MLLILALAITMPISLASCDNANLTTVTWDHAVNSWTLLNASLSSDVNFIEVDVILGEHTKVEDKKDEPKVEPKNTAETKKEVKEGDDKKDKNVPILAHPPNNQSDLSLEQFLGAVKVHNAKTNATKGVKLDFKSIEALTDSVVLLEKQWKDLKFPIWINADILKGPVNATNTPVDKTKFFEQAKKLTDATLSIGWTTQWGKNMTGSYTHEQIEEMTTTIVESKTNGTGHAITFPIRAGIAAHSQDALEHLYQNVSKTHPVTFTVWSAVDDEVDAKKLGDVIRHLGVDKVYVDVPKELRDQLRLNGASSLAKFGLLNLAAIALAMFFRSFLN